MGIDVAPGVEPVVDTGAQTEGTVEVSPQDPTSDTRVTVQEPVSRPEVQVPTQEEVLALQAQLAEQRKIQAGLDRANTQLQQQLESAQAITKELEERLGTYSAATDGNEGVIAEYQRLLTEAQQAAEEWQRQANERAIEVEKYKIILSENIGEHPIARFVEAGALPQTNDLDDFRARMATLQKGLSFAAEKPRVTKPPASPSMSGGTTADLNDLKSQMNAAAKAKDMDKLHELQAQWHETLNARGITS